MKRGILVFLMTIILPSTFTAKEVKTVPYVDLNQYLGKWYEIARLPLFFERNCIGDATAEYSLKSEQQINISNRCRTTNGWIESKGYANIEELSGNAKLRVTFFWPFFGNYWIIGLDPNYQWAVVGEPSKKYLWILSRDKVLSKSELDKAIEVALAQGYDLKKLIRTPQTYTP